MDDKTYQYLIKKYLEGKCSPEEERLLNDWYDAQDTGNEYLSRLTKGEKEVLEEELLNNIQQKNRLSGPVNGRKRIFRLAPYAAAAFILTFVGISILFYIEKQKLIEATSYGEIRNVILPDSSEIKLNGNSSLAFRKTMDRKREVWFSGEGAFRIRTKSRLPFYVHLNDTLTVVVLGTELNVSNRPGCALIALRNGRVRVERKSDKGVLTLDMNPRDILTFTKDVQPVERAHVKDIDNYFAWEQHKLLLRDMSLSQLCRYIRDTYGTNFEISDTALLSRRASGSIPVSSDREKLLNYMAALFEVRITPSNQFERYFVTAKK